MTLIEINRDPTNRQLRQFAVICLFALPLVGWIWGGSVTVIMLLAAIGLALAVTGFAVPGAVKPIFLTLMIVTIPIGLLIGELVLLVVYFIVLMPFGLVFRIMKRDALQLSLDRHAKSYWQAKKQPNGAHSYYRQS